MCSLKEKNQNATFQGAYESHFEKLNPLSPERFEQSAASYGRLYDPLMPKDKTARILDLGCGTGHFLHYLVTRGYANHLGVDVSEEFIKFVQRKITEKAVCEDALRFVEETDEKFRLITLNDFVEHIPKEKLPPFLSDVHGICAQNGKVFIKTINMTFPLSGWNRYMDFTHEIGFTEESISYLLELAGFSKVDVFPTGPRGMNAALRFLTLPLLRLLGRKIPRVVTPNLLATARA